LLEMMEEIQIDSRTDDDDEDDNDDDYDEALCAMLGISSLGVVTDDVTEEVEVQQNGLHVVLDDEASLLDVVVRHGLKEMYESQSFCIFPDCLSIPAELMRRLTEQLVWDTNKQSDKSYETIQVFKAGTVTARRTLTRLENFVDHDDEWRSLCYDRISHFVSALLGEQYYLYKEKLNLKPSGGTGFAPHLDTPSLRVALGTNGPRNFVTVMVAIDDMNTQNGCLRISPGTWDEASSCPVVLPDKDGSPDAGGRAGALATDVADSLSYQDIAVKAGTIVVFNGWAPHRSSANNSPFSRRAVFLTYNPAKEGSYHDKYYEKMKQLRNDWKEKEKQVGLRDEDEQKELDALSTIPQK
jgi:ectoine hydroxylase-related dioxygenase (phytanoyl-CoA dioxygenase family)